MCLNRVTVLDHFDFSCLLPLRKKKGFKSTLTGGLEINKFTWRVQGFRTREITLLYIPHLLSW